MGASYGRLVDGLGHLLGVLLSLPLWISVVSVAALLVSIVLVQPVLAALLAIALSWIICPRSGVGPRSGRFGALALLMVVIVCFGTLRMAGEIRALASVRTGAYHGWAVLVAGPAQRIGSARVVFEIDGQRFESYLREAEMIERLQAARGRPVKVSGVRRALTPERAGRVAAEHVVGRFSLDAVDAIGRPSRLGALTSVVRTSMLDGASVLPEEQRGLFLGLIIGDRTASNPEVTDRFRRTGLSHLLVASGLNVTLMLAAVSPLLGRLRPLSRWAITLVLIGWFASLVGFEPSILRASVMAAIAQTTFFTGHRTSALQALVLAVGILLAIDPLLVRSVGLWLSAGATAGVCGLGPSIARLLGRRQPPGRLATAVGVSIGAQVGASLPLLITFGSIPLISVPANLVAVPVASIVKVYGLVAALLAGLVPVLGPLLFAPLPPVLGLLDAIATVAVAVEPDGWVAVAGWAIATAALIGVMVVVRHRPATTGGRDGYLPLHRQRRIDGAHRGPRSRHPTRG